MDEQRTVLEIYKVGIRGIIVTNPIERLSTADSVH